MYAHTIIWLFCTNDYSSPGVACYLRISANDGTLLDLGTYTWFTHQSSLRIAANDETVGYYVQQYNYGGQIAGPQ